MRTICLLLACLSVSPLFAQHPADSSRWLREVVIDAYETRRSLDEVPAAIGVIEQPDLQRFSNTSILPAVNRVPGVWMEERSPGSYRFSIRGSSLRSPFGVRNVKVYWNGLPFTDGGGNTYLNLLDFSSFGSMEIIKGPGGSLYGAGTGGVLLIESPRVGDNQLEFGATAGSYGLQRYQLGGQWRSDNVTANVQLAHHRADGYRDQAAFERSAVNTEVTMRAGSRGSLTAMLLYSDLFYETPGGLTLAQFEDDPGQARPGGPGLGAEEALAAITNQTVFGGLVYDHDWNNQWTTTTGVYGAFSDFDNPSIRNYEAREETNFGLRTTTAYRIFRGQSSVGGKVTFGGEYQHFISPIRVFGNVGGRPDTLQVSDDLVSQMGLVFAQADLELPGEVFVTLGGSINFLHYDFTRVAPGPRTEQEKTFSAVFSPRVAVLKKFSDALSAYSSYSDGFSPPTLAEVRPSTNTFNRKLKAEHGHNVEVGARGTLFDRLHYDVALYNFSLRNTLVVQRSVDGADWFINAGRTSQRGVEALLSYEARTAAWPFNAWVSYAHQRYRYKDYVVEDEDFSGNRLTGVPANVLSVGADVQIGDHFAGHLTVNHIDEIPLNDANTAFAEAYTLVGFRADWNTQLFGRHRVNLFAGVDNALDEVYSLGNDLNAFGGRYYNAAMPRNYYAGVKFTLTAE